MPFDQRVSLDLDRRQALVESLASEFLALRAKARLAPDVPGLRSCQVSVLARLGVQLVAIREIEGQAGL